MTYLQQVFKVNEIIPLDLRIRNELYARNPKTVRYGTEAISFFSPKIWSLIPQNIILGPCHVSKKTLENGNPMSFIQNIFATYWFYLAQHQSSLFSF